MARNIDEDVKHFRDIIDGNLRKDLQRYIKDSDFVTLRPNGDRLAIPTKNIDIPRFVYGQGNTGVGRGPGKKGDVFRKDKKEGEKGEAGDETGDKMIVGVNLQYFLDELQKELKLPDMKPKERQTYEDVKIKYTNISLTGPESLRHNRRTILQALKRQAASGELEKLHYVPGCVDPVRLVAPINKDRRYRQYKEVFIPSSNAVIMFGRDGSGSMDDEKCSIVSDIAWWIDVWIRQFYAKVERCYFWHDAQAEEVDEQKFYETRSNGGTHCSSCLKLMHKQLENRFPPEHWNLYCFYFTDGENMSDDNPEFLTELENSFKPEICNLFGITQVLSNNYKDSIKYLVDKKVKSSKTMTNVKTASVGDERDWDDPFKTLGKIQRNEAVKNAIKIMLGGK